MTAPMVKIFEACQLFSGMEPDDLEVLASIAVCRKYAPGTQVFAEGEEAHRMYLIAGGRVRIYKLSTDGREQAIRVFGSGDVFAEAAMFQGGNYPAYAAAETACELVSVARKDLLSAMRRHPDLCMHMLATMAGRLRHMVGMIEELSLKDVPSRLATYLLHLQVRSGSRKIFCLDRTKTSLARSLGTIPETLSRTLRKMQAAGLIGLDGKEVNVIDRAGLERIAAGVKTKSP